MIILGFTIAYLTRTFVFSMRGESKVALLK
jgi:hypothetical protein